MKEVILTGIRSNDEPTLGNYLGALLPMVKLQHKYAGEYQINMFVPDLHSFTTTIDHAKLYENTIRNLKYFMAAGLNIQNEDTYIYRQSFISAHSEMAVILNNFTYFGEMSRMTEFKEKSESQTNVTVGLFDYPVLMAGDILLYGAQWVPIGDDQKQHLEITRDIGIRMNKTFGEIFTLPNSWKEQFTFMNLSSGARIRSLVNPSKKMSKSVSDPRGTILLSDAPADAAQKIIGATTDSKASINFDWVEQPGITNLLQILALITQKPQEEVTKAWQGSNRYGDLKKAVAGTVEAFLTDFQARYQSVDEQSLISKLERSEAAMSIVAETTLHRVQRAVGLRAK